MYPRVPGAEAKVGVEEVVGLKDGSGLADDGGRGGRDACAGDAVDKEDEVCGSFRPGGGGYDMMNGCTVKPWM